MADFTATPNWLELTPRSAAQPTELNPVHGISFDNALMRDNRRPVGPALAALPMTCMAPGELNVLVGNGAWKERRLLSTMHPGTAPDFASGEDRELSQLTTTAAATTALAVPPHAVYLPLRHMPCTDPTLPAGRVMALAPDAMVWRAPQTTSAGGGVYTATSTTGPARRPHPRTLPYTAQMASPGGTRTTLTYTAAHHMSPAPQRMRHSTRTRSEANAPARQRGGDLANRARVASSEHDSGLPPTHGFALPPRLPSLSLSLGSPHAPVANNATGPTSHDTTLSARTSRTLSGRTAHAEPSTGRISCSGVGDALTTTRSHSGSHAGQQNGIIGTTVARPCTALERQRARREVELYEQHLHYPNVTIPAAVCNEGDSEERRRRLEQRYKQVLYGKDTDGYRKYRVIVPTVAEREFHNPMHPITPRPENDCSKRAFDKYLNTWRRQLHQWDHCDVAHVTPAYQPLGVATLADLGLADATTKSSESVPETCILHSIASAALGQSVARDGVGAESTTRPGRATPGANRVRNVVGPSVAPRVTTSSTAETASRQEGAVLEFNLFASTPSGQESPLNYVNSILHQALHHGPVTPATQGGTESGVALRGCLGTTVEEHVTGPMGTLLRGDFDLISPLSARASPAHLSAPPTHEGRSRGATANVLDDVPSGVSPGLDTWTQLPAIYYPAAVPHSQLR